MSRHCLAAHLHPTPPPFPPTEWRSGRRTLGQREAARQRHRVRVQTEQEAAEGSLAGMKGHCEERWETEWQG